jgi:hypothetical protein
VAAEALEQSMLDGKDKDQLLAIAQALGIKTTARASKATLIDKILETTGAGSAAPSAAPPAPAEEPAPVAEAAPAPAAEPEVVLGPDGEPLALWEIELLRKGELELSAAAPKAAAKPGALMNSSVEWVAEPATPV